jgi:hypothetical protein
MNTLQLKITKNKFHQIHSMKFKMGLDHPLDGVTNPKYKLLHFLTNKKNCKEKKALAFDRDRCCHLVMRLQLILFQWTNPDITLENTGEKLSVACTINL